MAHDRAVEAAVREAETAGQPVTVVYYGGSQPGTRRVIKVRSVYDQNGILYAKAYCLSAGAPREFRLDRMQVGPIVESAPPYLLELPSEGVRNMARLVALIEKRYGTDGWTLQETRNDLQVFYGAESRPYVVIERVGFRRWRVKGALFASKMFPKFPLAADVLLRQIAARSSVPASITPSVIETQRGFWGRLWRSLWTGA